MNDSEYEFWTNDRIQKIQQIIGKYGEENFVVSFSGGKDSTVLSALIDMALPNNKIPRVFIDTGIELNIIRSFVVECQKQDNRVVIIKPSVPIKAMLETDGYPFKSKEHAACVYSYQNGNKDGKWVNGYLTRTDSYRCPNILRYQFSDDFHLKVSDKCCRKMKEQPFHKWQKENKKPYGILGLMREEGGRRNDALCISMKNNKLFNFQPLTPMTKDWEEWFIEKYNIKICDIYRPPYNFDRTGCKGCPFNPNLQKALDVLEDFFPNERKQCEIIWKPVYDEYRRIGYRLKPQKASEQMSIFDYI